MNALTFTDFQFPNQKAFYKGKVRDVYTLQGDILVMIATDRLSAFDVVLPQGIPFKGQILNQIASEFLAQTQSVVPNWLIATPDPNVSIGKLCQPFKVEMVVRGYLSGHAAREYQAGKRSLCGVPLPEGLKENDPLPHPIITPTTKADNGAHDMDISREEILQKKIVSEEDYQQLEHYALKLFAKGTEIAQKRGLILVDTKYEFGKDAQGQIRLIDEVHTPDSSRYFYEQDYRQRQEKGLPPRQLSKEFVRQWLIEQGFQGKVGQSVPPMTQDYIQSITDRYIELYEQLLGQPFQPAYTENIPQRIQFHVEEFLQKHQN